MTTKVKLTVESLHEGKKVSVCLADPNSGAVLGGTTQVVESVGGSVETYIHEGADLVVKEID